MEAEAVLPPAASAPEATLPAAGSSPVAESGVENGAATRLQKAYRGYRTRRKLANLGASSAAAAGEPLWSMGDTRPGERILRGSMRPASLDDGELWDDSASGDLGGSLWTPPLPTGDGSARCSWLCGTPAKEQHHPREQLSHGGEGDSRAMVKMVLLSPWSRSGVGDGEDGRGGPGGRIVRE